MSLGVSPERAVEITPTFWRATLLAGNGRADVAAHFAHYRSLFCEEELQQFPKVGAAEKHFESLRLPTENLRQLGTRCNY
jgi:hypothetical protein